MALGYARKFGTTQHCSVLLRAGLMLVQGDREGAVRELRELLAGLSKESGA